MRFMIEKEILNVGYKFWALVIDRFIVVVATAGLSIRSLDSHF